METAYHIALTTLRRGITGYLMLGGQVEMRRAAATRRRLLICQNMGGHLPNRPLRPCCVTAVLFVRLLSLVSESSSNHEHYHDILP